MAVGSTQWEWTNISRVTDSSMGAVWSGRRNWTVTRRRWSDSAYSSEEGDKSKTLTAYNGGVTESVTAPTNSLYGRKPSGSAKWTESGTIWVGNGGFVRGAPVYAPYLAKSKQNPVVATVIWSSRKSSLGNYVWLVAEMPVSMATSPPGTITIVGGQIYSGEWSTDNYGITSGTSSWSDVTGQNFNGNGTFSGGSGQSLGELKNHDGEFLCINDNQTYPIPGVDWYQQIQTWNYKEPW